MDLILIDNFLTQWARKFPTFFLFFFINMDKRIQYVQGWYKALTTKIKTLEDTIAYSHTKFSRVQQLSS